MKKPRAILISDSMLYFDQLKLLANICDVKSIFVKDYDDSRVIDYTLGIRKTFRYTSYIPSNLTTPFELVVYLTDAPLLSILSKFKQPSRPKDIIIVSALENQYEITLALAEDESRVHYAIRSDNHCVVTTIKARVTQTNSGSLTTKQALTSLIDLCRR